MIALIRHGQASFGAADYDQLSPLGGQQSKKLGAALARWRRPIEVLIAGPMKRHRQTADAMREGAAGALPELVFDEAFAEFPAFSLVRRFGPALASTDPVIAAGFAEGGHSDAFKRAVFRVIELWAEGAFDTEELESFARFEERVREGLDRVHAMKGQRVAVVTSGGPVGVAVRACLEIPPGRAMHLAWSVVNASVTEFVYRGGHPMLFRFNAHDHLDDEDGLITFV